ncbi:hybrid sensor histidine kinase/response regulator [Pseudodesulfovibrio portus]|uniref:histidine kinase n=1 Tax=Pseudodesulfovibrio portus TaxID=231439 RepID=A0ABN6S063_9BACT|nr:hybrid sensor histidine kinase/response regulator [Pseudodesulfovibrio portus]BDQ35061.1 hybrid sensor histidine kinase/response regulator [Pseudodesulfovibrio portus]
MAHRETILIVDDQPENITIMVEALKSSYALVAATDGESALERAGAEPGPDMILLDVMMPDMNGHELCRRLKEDPATRDIPVMFVTSLDKPDDEALGLSLGAVDYITKPISPPVVAARVRAHLQLKRAKELLESQNEVLEERVRERTAEVVRMQKERVESLNHFADALAHQIRNPVVSIGGMAGLMIKKAPEDSPLIEYAEAVREDGFRLERLVGVVREYVSLAAGGIQVAFVESMVEQALEKARVTAREMELGLECSMQLEKDMVGVDVRIVVLALTEILVNALEFATGETVHLTVEGGIGRFRDVLSSGEGGWKENRWYGVRITDDGPGIAGDVLPYVTDPFFTTKARGVGIGLTKVKRVICDEHGGTLLIRSPSENGIGTEVIFNLPLA